MIHIEGAAAKSKMCGSMDELLAEFVVAGNSLHRALTGIYGEDKAVALMAHAAVMMLGPGPDMTIVCATGGESNAADS